MSTLSAALSWAPLFPTPLRAYPPPSNEGLLATWVERATIDPFNAIATAIFLIAIVHTFATARFSALAHDWQHRYDARARAAGLQTRPSVIAESLHFLGEVEVVFGLWAVVLAAAMTAWIGWERDDTLSERYGQLHRAPVRGRHHGARVDEADRRRWPKPRLRRVARLGAARRPPGGSPS